MSSTEGIPIRRLVVHDPKDMPLHYGETPGGSIFSTTPGGKISFSSWKSNMFFLSYPGTRIYYDRAFLLSRRDSPMTRSPPSLPFIPEGLWTVEWIWEDVMHSNVLVTLIPEPEKNDNGVKADVKQGSNSLNEKPNLSASEQPVVANATAVKKGKFPTKILTFMFYFYSYSEGDDQFTMDMWWTVVMFIFVW